MIMKTECRSSAQFSSQLANHKSRNFVSTLAATIILLEIIGNSPIPLDILFNTPTSIHKFRVSKRYYRLQVIFFTFKVIGNTTIQ